MVKRPWTNLSPFIVKTIKRKEIEHVNSSSNYKRFDHKTFSFKNFLYIPRQTASDIDKPNNRSSRIEYDSASSKGTYDRDLKIASLSFKNGCIQFIANGQSVRY